jgi:hypothetical protein
VARRTPERPNRRRARIDVVVESFDRQLRNRPRMERNRFSHSRPLIQPLSVSPRHTSHPCPERRIRICSFRCNQTSCKGQACRYRGAVYSKGYAETAWHPHSVPIHASNATLEPNVDVDMCRQLSIRDRYANKPKRCCPASSQYAASAAKRIVPTLDRLTDRCFALPLETRPNVPSQGERAACPQPLVAELDCFARAGIVIR